MKSQINVIVGPTASGKSLFGLYLAEKKRGEIINADSMQIYKDLKILSARPAELNMCGISHHLYGFLDSFSFNTVYDWLIKAVEIAKEIENPIFIGGTGLYVDALINGVSPIPLIDNAVRLRVRQMDIEEIRQKVLDCPFQDPQRLRRAFEVQLSTGKTLTYFQSLPKVKKIDADFRIYFINPPRIKLYRQCDARFKQMIESGAIEEVRHLLDIHATGGVMKAIGVSQISAYLNGLSSYEEMCKNIQTQTRHYAKRQVTWFRHHLDNVIEFENPECVSML